MGYAGISPGSLIIIFLLVLLLFGKQGLRSVAKELAETIKVFKATLDTNEPSNASSDDKPHCKTQDTNTHQHQGTP